MFISHDRSEIAREFRLKIFLESVTKKAHSAMCCEPVKVLNRSIYGSGIVLGSGGFYTSCLLS
jgi:hypothetical protein